jgi:hypothetical protein
MQVKDPQTTDTLLSLILPDEIFDFFEVTNIKTKLDTIEIYLDELNTPPEEYSKEELESKGFVEATTVQDFPIRDKFVYLYVRRRKWKVKSNNKIVSRDWKMTAKGTRYTKSFAAFLKEVLG